MTRTPGVAGRVVLRMALGGSRTERRHVEAAWHAIRDAHRRG